MIIIQDNFLKDPYRVRAAALDQRFNTITEEITRYKVYDKKENVYKFDEEGFYPGCINNFVPDNIQKPILNQVRHLTGDDTLETTYTTFHYVTKEYGEGTFHYDKNKYLSLIFLSLNTEPDSGTEVCDIDGLTGHCDKVGSISQETWDKCDNARHEHVKDPKNFLKSWKYARLSKGINSNFDPIAIVPNVFNRLFLFDASLYHRQRNSFGTSIENSRLTLLSFFD